MIKNMVPRSFCNIRLFRENFNNSFILFRCIRTQENKIQNIKLGDKLPDSNIYKVTSPNALKIRNFFSGKKGILFSVPGAFTPGCSKAHIPEYLNNYDKFQAEGYSIIACISVNDPFVMAAWGKAVDPDGKIEMLADMKCDFTKAIGMELDCTPLLGNVRSKRYSMLIEDNIVRHISQEPDDTGLACLLCIEQMKKNEIKLGVESAKKKSVPPTPG